MRVVAICLSAILFVGTNSDALPNCTFRFANTLGNHMVLQQTPSTNKIWGFAPQGTDITVGFNSFSEVVQSGNNCQWAATLEPQKANATGSTITATMAKTTIALTDVLFGDVWLCGGQSNMQFALSQVFNASVEIAAAAKYPHIRVFTPTLEESATPIVELKSIFEPWSVASPQTVSNGKSFSYFSAVCWLFGRQLYDEMKYPIGLIASNWGGTPVRAWSSPTVISECGVPAEVNVEAREHTNLHGPSGHSVLWNAMIVPFLKTSIYGAIWYQGEADCSAQYENLYACTFSHMIADWRKQFSANSGSNAMFPFGFVQLSAWNDKNAQKDCGDSVPCIIVPNVRWGQTSNVGYTPNPSMPKVFMAPALDLGDPTSPYGDVHPRYKQQVATRLFEAGLAVAYGRRGGYSVGPHVAAVMRTSDSTIDLLFENVGEPLSLKHSEGLEVLSDGHWVSATIASVRPETKSVVVETSGAKNITQMRYLWKQAPCQPTVGILDCAIYSGSYPALPFKIKV